LNSPIALSSEIVSKTTLNPFRHTIESVATAGANKRSSENRFAQSTPAVTAVSAGILSLFALTASTAGGPTRKRGRTKHDEKRNQSIQVASAAQTQQAAELEPVTPLQLLANQWDREVFAKSTEVVVRKVRALLNKLTMKKFNLISDQIIEWANKLENEKDGQTLIQVVNLVCEAATDGLMMSEVYARLCRRMMEQISPNVRDDGIKNAEGKPIAGSQLFQRYLLNRCQQDFKGGWVAQEAAAASIEGWAVKETKDQKVEHVRWYEYYAAQKAK